MDNSGQEDNYQFSSDIQIQKGDTGVPPGNSPDRTSGTSDTKWKDNIDKQLNEIGIAQKNLLDYSMGEMEKLRKEWSDQSNVLSKVLENLWPNIISVFGIFASIVTFTVTEIQIFKMVCDPFRAVGLSMIMFSMLMGFVSVILHVFAGVKNWISFGVILPLAFLLLGVLMFIGVRSETVCGDQNLEKKYDELRVRLDTWEKTGNSLNIDVSNRVK